MRGSPMERQVRFNWRARLRAAGEKACTRHAGAQRRTRGDARQACKQERFTAYK